MDILKSTVRESYKQVVVFLAVQKLKHQNEPHCCTGEVLLHYHHEHGHCGLL